MDQGHFVKQVARPFQVLDNLGIGGENMLAGQPVRHSSVNRPDGSTGLSTES